MLYLDSISLSKRHFKEMVYSFIIGEKQGAKQSSPSENLEAGVRYGRIRHGSITSGA